MISKFEPCTYVGIECDDVDMGGIEFEYRGQLFDPAKVRPQTTRSISRAERTVFVHITERGQEQIRETMPHIVWFMRNELNWELAFIEHDEFEGHIFDQIMEVV